MYSFKLLNIHSLSTCLNEGLFTCRRMTILPTVDELKQLLNRFKDFHVRFMKKYS